MRLIHGIPFCTLITLSTLCLAQATSARDAAKAGACGPESDHFAVRNNAAPAPAAGNALVYIVEVQDTAGLCVKCSITAKVGVDGNWVGATYGNSRLAIPVDAGEQHLCTSWQSDISRWAILTGLDAFTAEPGKVYYFRTHVAIATEHTPDRFTLEALNQDEGKLLVASSARSESRKK